MAIIRNIFNLTRRTPGDGDAAARFLAKSENFRLLLTANNEALERMGEMSVDAKSGGTFGMAHVRASSLRTAAAVRGMIERLCRMCPGKYDELKDVFNRIVMEMETALVHRTDRPTGPLTLGLDVVRAGAMPETGSKMALLGEIALVLDLRIPRGFSITGSAFRRFMEHAGLDDEINRLIQITDSSELDELRDLETNIRRAIDMAAFPPGLEEAIEDECARLGLDGKDVRLAVRSSALGEDSEEASFAGQFLTVLGVRPDDVAEAYRSVVASMYSATAMLYRFNRGLREDGVVMCVGCMEMVNATAGGVVYTRNPASPGEGVLVSAAPGLPCTVVDGSALIDTWIVNRDSLEVVRAEIADKQWEHSVGPGGSIIRRELGEGRSALPAIGEDLVVELARNGLAIEGYFGGPQDVEWALGADGHVYYLQCRPLAVGTDECEPGHAENDADASFAILTSAVPASPGVAGGTVFRVETDEDMLDFPDGAVLLTRNARPQLSALLPRAAALVAEFGSPASHLANVAREFSVPALIGAPGAVDRLSGVSAVTVDARNGTVYLGIRRERIEAAGTRKGVARENDVVHALRRLLPFVAPLNLTDPESPDFKPDNCRSLHDITRYCHEKAVQEMFSGAGQPTANARKLKGELPMQYWLVDIGGGTAESEEEGYISLDNVRSGPMLALWHGMTVIPWDGPPPASVSGFMSVVTQAAQNPALMPGVANDMGRRNYFIVGRNYCNLQSRFGFHFCTVEGFAGSDPTANYALFQYRGGGADISRRSVRIGLVAEVLDRHGFIVEAREDALHARIEGVARRAVEQSMAVMGYLLMHTRQIDMAMADRAVGDRYRAKFAKDIETVLENLPEIVRPQAGEP
ncbi:PEP/pyruvate-binding domain-containing protein [Pseudodesulfovibrio sp.]|uniref:PEP/pyruvate-binding domain-containing protein n=1 Tax=unclassified Pseudodesulfovibrio TaxID=2661612 RepID=UPI003B007BAD